MSTPKSFELSGQMARPRRRRELNQPYEQEQQQQQNSRRERWRELNHPYEQQQTGSVHVSAQRASVPALSIIDDYFNPYYYMPQGTITAPRGTARSPSRQCNDWALGRSHNQGSNPGLQTTNPLAGFPGAPSQHNTISDSNTRSISTGWPSCPRCNNPQLSGNNNWRDDLGTGSACLLHQPIRNQANLSGHMHDQFTVSNSGSYAQIAAAGYVAYTQANMRNNYQVNMMAPVPRLQAGGVSSYDRNALSFNTVPPRLSYPESDTHFLPTALFQNSTPRAFPKSNVVSPLPQTTSQQGNNTIVAYESSIRCNSGNLAAPPRMTCTPANMFNGTQDGEVGTSENMNAKPGKRIQSQDNSVDEKPKKRGVGRPPGSSSVKKEHKTKRSTSTSSEVSIQQIQIGQWGRTSETGHDVLAKCYSQKRKLVWEILCGVTKLKIKMEMKWSSVVSIKSVLELFQLTLKLSESPIFYREKIDKAKIHSSWTPCEDFTNGEASRNGVMHTLVFEQEMYEKYMRSLRSNEQLQDLLNKGMRAEDSNVVMHLAYVPGSYSSVGTSAEMVENTQAAENAQIYNMPMNYDEVWNSLDEPLLSNGVPLDVSPIQKGKPDLREYTLAEIFPEG